MQTRSLDVEKGLKSLKAQSEKQKDIKKEISFLERLSQVQKVVFWISLVLIPIAVMPLPWGWSEYSKGILLIAFTTVLVVLEILKVLFSGKISLFKGTLDYAVLFIMVSVLISTAFSLDFGLSAQGFDQRLGSGAISIFMAFLYSYVFRSFVVDESDLLVTLDFLMVGIGLSAFLSILSFFQINPYSWLPYYENLFTVGVTTFSDMGIAVVTWTIGLAMALYNIYVHKAKRSDASLVVSIVSAIMMGMAFVLFTIGHQMELAILSLSFLVLVAGYVYMNKAETFKQNVVLIISLVTVILVGFFVMQNKAIQDKLPNNDKRIAQLKLDMDSSWKIVTSTLSESARVGVLGLGHDTYSISYMRFKPLQMNNIDLNMSSLSYANSEVLNILAGRGILGVLIWVVLCGYLLSFVIYSDLKRRKVSDNSSNLILLMDFVLLYLFMSSFFVYFGFMLYLLLFVLVSLNILTRSVFDRRSAEAIVLHMDFLVEKIGQDKVKALPLALSVLTLVAGFTVLYFVGKDMRSSMYVMEAESHMAEAREKLSKEKLSPEAAEKALLRSIGLYELAIKGDSQNSVLHRRSALLIVDYVKQLGTRYSELDKNKSTEEGAEEKMKQLESEISNAVEFANQYGQKSTEISPSVYANWDARTYAYSEFVGLGFKNFTKSGLSAIQRGLQLNPMNYALYFTGAQLYVVEENPEAALNTLNGVFEINGNHLPSLILASELSSAAGKNEDAKALLTRAKEVLEALEQKDSDLYKQVIEKLGELENSVEAEEEPNSDIEEDDTGSVEEEGDSTDTPVAPPARLPEG